MWRRIFPVRKWHWKEPDWSAKSGTVDSEACPHSKSEEELKGSSASKWIFQEEFEWEWIWLWVKRKNSIESETRFRYLRRLLRYRLSYLKNGAVCGPPANILPLFHQAHGLFLALRCILFYFFPKVTGGQRWYKWNLWGPARKDKDGEPWVSQYNTVTCVVVTEILSHYSTEPLTREYPLTDDFFCSYSYFLCVV